MAKATTKRAAKKKTSKNTAATSSTTKKKRQVVYAGSEYKDIPKFYVNNANITTSVYDVRMLLGQIVERDEEKLVVEPKLTLLMSLPHAKAIMNILNKQLAAYEEQNGSIPDPGMIS